MIIETLKNINCSNLRIYCTIRFNDLTYDNEISGFNKLLDFLKNENSVKIFYDPLAAKEFPLGKKEIVKENHSNLMILIAKFQTIHIESNNAEDLITEFHHIARVKLNPEISTNIPNKFDSLKEMILYRFFQNKTFDEAMAEYFSQPKAIEEGIKLLNISGVEEGEGQNLKPSPTPTYIKQEKSFLNI